MKHLTIGALLVGLILLGLLRFWDLIVTTGDVVSALLEGVALTIFTGGLVAAGVVVLWLTTSHRVSRALRQARINRRRAAQARRRANNVREGSESRMREHMGRAQVFASHCPELSDLESRRRFLAYVQQQVAAAPIDQQAS